jgi:hypothetical protein
MATEVVTVEDLEKFRIRLLVDLAKMMQRPERVEPLLRSGEVRKMLNISPGTLQKLRIKGVLPYSRLDGSYRYKVSDVQKAIEGIRQ